MFGILKIIHKNSQKIKNQKKNVKELQESSNEKLKNYLTPVVTYADLLSQEILGNLSDPQKEKIELIKEQANKITNYLEAIKDEGVSQTESAKPTDQVKKLEFNPHRRKLKERIIQVSLNENEKYPDFRNDPSQELRLNVLQSELRERITQAALLLDKKDYDSVMVEKNPIEYDIDTFSREIIKIRKNSKNILVIYNNRSLCKIFEAYLKHEGHDCVCAVDGRSGLSLIETKKFDVVLLGLTLPEFSGYDIINVLEKNGKLRKSNIIILSSVHLPQSEIEDLLKRGVCSYLQQPVKPDVLLRILETVYHAYKNYS